MKHQKHGKATLYQSGNYGQFELAMVGTNCGQIKEFASELKEAFQSINVAYIDASHDHEEKNTSEFSMNYLDQQDCFDIHIDGKLEKYDQRFLFQQQDIILINGNHFQASCQIVFLDRKKEKSLLKRKNQLTNIKLFIQVEEDDYFPDFLYDIIKEEEDINIIHLNDIPAITEVIWELYESQLPPVYGLVLAGGRSTRMGQDKGKLKKEGKDLRIHLFETLEKQVDHCYFSGRSDQMEELNDYPFIEDRLTNMGPFGAILSAFMLRPDVAWLVVACDLVESTESTFQQLIEARDVSKVATSFYSEVTGLPDPMPSIWEPKSYSRLLHFLSIGYSCPRKVLINSDTLVIHPNDKKWLFNMNTPDDAEVANLSLD